MGWDTGSDSSPGDEPEDGAGLPGAGENRPGLFAAFEHGGSWDAAGPSAALAGALEKAAGPGGLYDDATAGAMVGIVRQWAAVESWAAAGLMGAMRAMMREDGSGHPLLRRDLGLPDGWDDSLNYEIAEALAMGPVSATNLANLAWALGMRLPGIGRLLAEGILTRSKAKLVVQIFGPLDEEEAARAEALIVGELAGKTYFQVERLAWRAALAVAPDVAERRRAKAEKQARVTVFREEAGTAGLSGRDLPAADALAGHANVLALADAYAKSGAFPGHALSRLQALAYLDLLNGVSAADRIAFARTSPAQPPGDPEPPGPSGPPGPETPEPGSPEPGSPEPGDAGREPGPAGRLPEVIIPFATLHGQAAAGENRLLGPLDPALALDLAVAAARSPHSAWEVIIVDGQGYAIGHGIARPRRGRQRAARTTRHAGTALGHSSFPAAGN
jgi:hypothetical protein